jgi:hypothetical protein
MKDETAREINTLDQALKADPALQPPLIEYEEGDRRCLSLRTVIPSRRIATVLRLPRGAPAGSPALALFVVQNPLEGRLPEGTKWTATAASGLSMRTTPLACSRARVLGALVEKYIHNEGENNWVSLASGAAIPVLEALQCKTRRPAGVPDAGG